MLMMKKSKLISLVLATALTLGLAACGGQESDKSKIDQIKEAGVLVVGTSADYPPVQFHTEIDGQDTIVGVEISIAQEIADSLGVEMKIVDMSFDNLVMSLKNGEFDIVASTMKPSEKRKESVDFTDSWHENKTVIVTRKENESLFAKPEDMAGHKVTAQNGAAQYDKAVEYAGADNVVGLGKVQDMILEVQNGKVDAALLEALTAEAFASAHDDLVVLDVDIPWDGQGAAIGVQKGCDDLKEHINGIIADLKETDKLSQFVVEASALADAQ